MLLDRRTQIYIGFGVLLALAFLLVAHDWSRKVEVRLPSADGQAEYLYRCRALASDAETSAAADVAHRETEAAVLSASGEELAAELDRIKAEHGCEVLNVVPVE